MRHLEEGEEGHYGVPVSVVEMDDCIDVRFHGGEESGDEVMKGQGVCCCM